MQERSPQAQRYLSILAYGATLIALLLLWLLLRRATPAPISEMPWDCLIILEGGWRCLNGQIPHLDFYSPLGLVYPYITALGFVLSGHTGGAIASGYNITALVVAMLTLYLAMPRLGPGGGAAFSIFLFLLLTAPSPLGISYGESPFSLSYAMQYNRLGWGLFLSMALGFLLRPASENLPRSLAEGFILGLFVSLLVVIKPNYAVAACSIAALAFLLIRRNRVFRTTLLLAGLVSIVAYATLLRFNLDPAIGDYFLLSQVGAGSLASRLEVLGDILRANTLNLISVLLSLLIALIALHRATSRRWSENHSQVLLLALSVFAGLTICAGNSQLTSIPTFVLFAGILASLLLPLPNTAIPRPWKLVLLLSLIPCINSGVIILYQDFSHILLATEENPRQAEVHFEASIDSDIVDYEFLISVRDYQFRPGQAVFLEPEQWFALELSSPDRNRRRVLTPFQYVYYVNSGLSALSAAGAFNHPENPRILNLDFHNPFPLALGLPYPRHTAHWWDRHKTANARHHPGVDLMLKDVTHVLIPRVPTHPNDAEDFQRALQFTLGQRVKAVHEDRFWTVISL